MDYGHRVCAACSQDLPRSAFSRNQWSSKGTSGGSRCSDCVAGGFTAAAESLPAARVNACSRAVLDKGNPFAAGTFRLVARGEYIDGDREGQLCVAKWFKSGLRKEASFFDVDRLVTDRAVQLLNQYIHGAGRSGPKMRLNVPQVWTRLPREVLRVYRRGGVKRGPQVVVAGTELDGKKVLVEPYIEDYHKFNSNTGWVSEGRWAGVVAALSHFSYHVSGGQLVLCDLQGSHDRETGLFIFSDPVILSREVGRYGPTDLGPLGISTFFSQHTCSAHCRRDWMTPADSSRYLKVVDSTSMTCRSAAARSVGVMSAIREDDEEYEDDY